MNSRTTGRSNRPAKLQDYDHWCLTQTFPEADPRWMAENPATELYELADAVCDEASFLAFIEALYRDWNDEQRKEKKNPSAPHGPGANGWENGTIGTFLEAAHSWGEAWQVHNEGSNPQEDNPWRRAAEIVHAGKFYE